MTVSSVSLGHAATNPEAGDSQSPLSPQDPRALNRLRDGLTHETRGIANRLTFESRQNGRDPRNSSGDTLTLPAMQTTSSTSRQCWRRGWAAWGRIRVLIWGSLAPVRASLSSVVAELFTHPISSVCRFGRDCRHLTKGGKLDLFHIISIVMNL